jgi:hypothetical protein
MVCQVIDDIKTQSGVFYFTVVPLFFDGEWCDLQNYGKETLSRCAFIIGLYEITLVEEEMSPLLYLFIRTNKSSRLDEHMSYDMYNHSSHHDGCKYSHFIEEIYFSVHTVYYM